jgi:hypothetical protein
MPRISGKDKGKMVSSGERGRNSGSRRPTEGSRENIPRNDPLQQIGSDLANFHYDAEDDSQNDPPHYSVAAEYNAPADSEEGHLINYRSQTREHAEDPERFTPNADQPNFSTGAGTWTSDNEDWPASDDRQHGTDIGAYQGQYNVYQQLGAAGRSVFQLN